MKFPQEIQDKIFLLLDYNTLERTRDLQSDYVKQCTKYNNLYSAITTKNILNERWLRQQGITYLPASLSEAALTENNIEVLEFMYKDRCRWDNDTFEIAAQMGNLTVLKWLHSKGCHIGPNVFSSAALNGNLENMKWLLGIGTELNSNVFNSSAQKGYLDNLKWLHAQGCPEGDVAIENAISGGHLEIVKWLIDIGHEVKDFTFTIAITHNANEILKFLKEQKTHSRITRVPRQMTSSRTEDNFFALITQ